MIRNDLSTIWCELTSSIRTRPLDDAADIGRNDVPDSKADKNGSGGGKGNSDGTNESAASSQPSEEEVKELLLCFRPIREGTVVGEDLRFCPKVSDSEKESSANNSASSGAKKASSCAPSSTETQAAVAPVLHAVKNRPPKKRKFSNEDDLVNSMKAVSKKRRSSIGSTQVDDQDEKSAVESMMELAKNKSPL